MYKIPQTKLYKHFIKARLLRCKSLLANGLLHLKMYIKKSNNNCLCHYILP